MVGLSIVLESEKGINGNDNQTNVLQVVNKTTMIISNNKPSTQTLILPLFLQHCFLCKHTILPGKDIYMYKGDRGYCSVECRCKQIFIDEEESLRKKKCSMVALTKLKPNNSSSSSSSTSSSFGRTYGGTRNRVGGFAY